VDEHARTMRDPAPRSYNDASARLCTPVDDICNYIIDNIDARWPGDLSRIVRAPRVHGR